MKFKTVSLALVLAVVSTAAAADQFVFRYRLTVPIDRMAPMATTPETSPEPETPPEETTPVWITDAPARIDVSDGTFPPITLHAAGGDSRYYQWQMISGPEWLEYVQTTAEAVTLQVKPGATIPDFTGEDAIMIQVSDNNTGADVFIILSGKPF